MIAKTQPTLGHADFQTPSAKRAYNRALFSVVAPAYPRVTRTLSLGQDRRWKETLVSWLPDHPRPMCVDLACGTGDMSALLFKKYSGGARVLGIDLSAEMMRGAQNASDERTGAALIQGDMSALPLEDASVDIVTAAYAIRNAPALDTAVREIGRILKPGGVAAILDFSKPESRRTARVELALLGLWGRLFGVLYHGNAAVYGYIAESLAHFPDRVALTDTLAAHGLRTVRTAYPFLGFLELRLAIK